MTAIEASSVRCATMADGTLRLVCDIDPRNAQAAFALFAGPGTPMALAALVVGYVQKIDTSPELVQKTQESIHVNDGPTVKESLTAEKPKGGALAKLAGMWCNDPEFWAWVNANTGDSWWLENQFQAKLFITSFLGIQSRTELDHDPVAAEKFHRLIRGPYQKHLIALGIVA